jgi:hypothetical protein
MAGAEQVGDEAALEGLIVGAAARACTLARPISSRAVKGAVMSAMTAAVIMGRWLMGGHSQGRGGMWKLMAVAPEPAAGGS